MSQSFDYAQDDRLSRTNNLLLSTTPLHPAIRPSPSRKQKAREYLNSLSFPHNPREFAALGGNVRKPGLKLPPLVFP
ncbi:hypothetical protein [Pedobacter aquatilis]|uniref:hypothetical protein n=1 Tax=Pedobacter aquatilis TaxID=351343 RepID=UPI00292CF966|nr:hypothetical protein [Pedobacter aquatilis]